MTEEDEYRTPSMFSNSYVELAFTVTSLLKSSIKAVKLMHALCYANLLELNINSIGHTNMKSSFPF